MEFQTSGFDSLPFATVWRALYHEIDRLKCEKRKAVTYNPSLTMHRNKLFVQCDQIYYK